MKLTPDVQGCEDDRKIFLWIDDELERMCDVDDDSDAEILCAGDASCEDDVYWKSFNGCKWKCFEGY